MKSEKEEPPKSVVKDPTDSFTHDKFVRCIWSEIPFAKLFFKYFLPEPILNAIDLETLKPIPTSNVNEEGREQTGDVFYTVNLKQGVKMFLVVLLEHKSTYDRYVSVQTLRYESMTYDRMVHNRALFQNEQGLLPTPFSILLCQHDHPQLDDLLYRIDGFDYGSHFRYLPINIQKIDFEKLRDELLLCAILELVRYSDKPNKVPNDPELLKPFIDLKNSKTPDPHTILRYFKIMLNYTAWFMKDTPFSSKQFRKDLKEKGNVEMPDAVLDFFSEEIEQIVEEKTNELLEEKTNELREQIAQSDARAAQSEARVAQLAQNVQFAREFMVKTIHNRLRIKFEELVAPKEFSERLEQIQELNTLSEIDSLIDVCETYDEFLRHAYRAMN